MSVRRVLVNAVRRRRQPRHAGAPAVPWGRIGTYEAVTRSGMLLLLSPEPAHPSRRVTHSA